MRHTNPISRRQFLRGAAGGSALVLLAACAVPTASVPPRIPGKHRPWNPSPSPSGTSWGGVRDEQLKTVLDDFSATYPEITVGTPVAAQSRLCR